MAPDVPEGAWRFALSDLHLKIARDGSHYLSLNPSLMPTGETPGRISGLAVAFETDDTHIQIRLRTPQRDADL